MTQKEFDVQMSAINMEQAKDVCKLDSEHNKLMLRELELYSEINELHSEIRRKKNAINEIAKQRVSISTKRSECNKRYHSMKHELNLKWQQEYVQ